MNAFRPFIRTTRVLIIQNNFWSLNISHCAQIKLYFGNDGVTLSVNLRKCFLKKNTNNCVIIIRYTSDTKKKKNK